MSLESEPSEEAQLIAEELIRGIEKTEGIALNRASPDQVAKYIHELSKLLALRLKESVGVDRDRGEQLLRDLRKNK